MDDTMDDPTNDPADDPAPDFTEGLSEYGDETPAEDIVAAFAARIGPELDEIAHNVRLLVNASTSEIWERGSAAGKKPYLGDLLRLDEEVDSAKKLNAQLRRVIQMVKNEGFGTDLRQVMRAQGQRTAELNAREEICIETEIALDKKDEAMAREKEQHWEEFRGEQRDWNAAVKAEKEKLKQEEERLKMWSDQLGEREKKLKQEEGLAKESSLRAIFRRLKNKLKK